MSENPSPGDRANTWIGTVGVYQGVDVAVVKRAGRTTVRQRTQPEFCTASRGETSFLYDQLYRGDQNQVPWNVTGCRGKYHSPGCAWNTKPSKHLSSLLLRARVNSQCAWKCTPWYSDPKSNPLWCSPNVLGEAVVGLKRVWVVDYEDDIAPW